MSKRPWFPFYVSTWRGSRSVRLLKREARSMYLDLLCEIWEDGPLPDDPIAVALLLGEPADALAMHWPGIRSLLFEVSPGRLSQERLEEERLKADEVVAKQSEKGKKGAKKRWDDRKNAAAIAAAMLDALPAAMQEGMPADAQLQLQEDQENSLSRVKGTTPQAWGAGRLSALWIETIKKTPTGNFQVLVEAADRIALSAVTRSTTVETHATRLLQSFASLVDGWRKAKRPTPQLSVEAFLKNFTACEEVIDGERDSSAVPVVDQRREEQPQREYEDLETAVRKNAPVIP